MNESLALLVIVVGTAIAFGFTNGFHDTANAMATSIATRALKPRVAVTLCALLNFAGALDLAVVALTALVCLAALVIGSLAMTHK